jgi:hypothetical protein
MPDRLYTAGRFRFKNLLLLVCLVAAGFSFPMLGRSEFWTSDDVINLLFFSGGFSGTREILNPVVGPEFGFLVTTLYWMFPGVPWYPILLVLLPVAGSYLLLREILKNQATKSLFLPLSLVFVPILVLVGTRPNYTLSAFVGSATAVVLMVLRCLEAPRRAVRLVAPLLVCFVSASLRTGWPVVEIVGSNPYLFVVILTCCLVLPTLHARHYRAGLLASFLLIVPYAVSRVTQFLILESQPDWKKYLEFYHWRAAIHGNATVQGYLESSLPRTVESQTGLDQLELSLIQNWVLFDQESPSVEELKSLSDAAESWYLQNGLMSRVVAYVRSASQFLIDTAAFLPIATILLQGTSLYRSVVRRAAHLILVGVAAAIPLFVLGYTSHKIRMPEYVQSGTGAAILLATFAAMAICEQSHSRTSLRSLWTIMPITAVMVLCSFSLALPEIHSVFTRHGINRTLAIEVRSELEQSRVLDRPTVSDIRVWPRGYSLTPFDTEIPASFLTTMEFSVGSNIRSPQHVRRWNVLMNQQESSKTLFNSSFWTRVWIHEKLAEELQQSPPGDRGYCYRVVADWDQQHPSLRRLRSCTPLPDESTNSTR